jgi:ribosomal protein S12 methylthiotransferase accessory factor
MGSVYKAGMPVSRPLPERALDRLGQAIGVTRLARITHLDRAGVEVAAAIRPGGHVLQVSTGKGETWAAAARGALSEAAELTAAERPRVDARGSYAELAGQLGEAVVDPTSLAPDQASPDWPDLRLAWREAADLATGAGGRGAPPPPPTPATPVAARSSNSSSIRAS